MLYALSSLHKLGYLQLKTEQLKIKFIQGRDVFAAFLLAAENTLHSIRASSVAGVVDYTMPQPKQRTLDDICPQVSKNFDYLLTFQLHKFSLHMRPDPFTVSSGVSRWWGHNKETFSQLTDEPNLNSQLGHKILYYFFTNVLLFMLLF